MAPVGGYDLRAPVPDGSTHPFDRCESAKANNHASRAYSMRRGPEGGDLAQLRDEAKKGDVACVGDKD